MTISIWRYSHLTLAISSSLFIIIACITGIILAFEPISDKLEPYSVKNINNISVASTISALFKKYDEVIELKVDENNFVSASVITKKGKSKTFYINPRTGTKIGDIIEKSIIFEFATNLHRSLFLKSMGRFIIGFTSFLLFLISITGIILISKRQGGMGKILSKIVKENTNQYYHIIIGRFTLIPIIIITITGVFLSLGKFSVLTKNHNLHQNITNKKVVKNSKIKDFNIFKTLKLNEIKKIEFPFSKDEEDYFFVKLVDNEFAVHQFNGQVISQRKESLIALGSYYSLLLHTGQGSIIWSIILLLASLSILFFIFSGFSMTLKRKKGSTSINNKTSKEKAEYIILVGSETGSTVRFANAFKNGLIKAKKEVFITELNKYAIYENAKSIVIFTATYGEGDAPANAYNFINLINSVQQENNLKVAVVGFGSKAYPEFCKYATLVNLSLQRHSKFTILMPVFKINNQNINSFNNWVNEWCKKNTIHLTINTNDIYDKNNITTFQVIEKSNINIDDTFLISFKSNKKRKFRSGDILSINPNNKETNRLYSIAKIDNKLLLSIKKHQLGLCSNYLYKLNKYDYIEGTIQQNKKFNFPKKSKEVILIANGTGIAPFLGMIKENKKAKIHLFWGGKSKKSFEIYNKLIIRALENKKLTSLNIVYSQEQKEKKYVQDILNNHVELVIKILQNRNHILICGSLKMQEGVENVLDIIAKSKLNSSVKKLKESNLIKVDCY